MPKLKTVLFDLDGTLLPMDQDEFTKCYFKLLAGKLAPHGYDPEQLVPAIWKGTASMVKNDGTKTNEEAFWETFTAVMKPDALDDKAIFDEFYRNEFMLAKSSCGFNPAAAETVARIKNIGLRAALATNPIFPATATKSRIRWAGLSPDDFEIYTTYENSRFCKPNPKYFSDVVNAISADPAECLMVGNDMGEDTPAKTLGMRVFILTDCLINKSGADISEYPHGGFDELMRYIEEQM